MRTRKLLGGLLLVVGILSLVYRGFSYTRETHQAKLGPLRVELQEKERIRIPVWAGVASALVGGALLGWDRKRKKETRN